MGGHVEVEQAAAIVADQEEHVEVWKPRTGRLPRWPERAGIESWSEVGGPPTEGDRAASGRFPGANSMSSSSAWPGTSTAGLPDEVTLVGVTGHLIDRDAVQSGATTSGSPWQYFDVGHGYCTYSFFEQCPHRMACPRCDFYVPKGSSRAQLLEAKANLQRMLVEIPLSEEERAAVEDGQAAVERLLERLADVPTPAGPTPRWLGSRLPVIAAPDARREPIG